MAATRTPEIIQIFIWITELGILRVFIPLSFIIAIMLWLAHRRWLILPLYVSLGGSMAVTILAKYAFHRPRPLEAILVEHTYSFPSGHATIAISLYGFLAYLLIRTSQTWQTRFSWLLIGLTFVSLIGFSRIVLGVHYLSDVIVGYLIGGVWLLIGIYMSEWIIAKGKVNFSDSASRTERKAIVILVFLLILGCGLFAKFYQPLYRIPLSPKEIQSNQLHTQLQQTLTIHENPTNPHILK